MGRIDIKMVATKSAIFCWILAFLIFANTPLVLNDAEEWLSIEDEYFIVKYREGYKSDAELILEYCEFSRNVTMQVYPHELDVKVTVYLYDLESWSRSPFVAWADPKKAEIYLLTPSDVPDYAKGWVDNLWYQHALVHEYVHIPTLRDLWNTRWYYCVGPPWWLDEGIAEYIAVFCTTEEILQKHHHYIGDMRNTLIHGSAFFEDYDDYRWGAYIMKYVYETYGKEKVSLLFKTDAEYFWDAVNRSLGVSPQEFERNWIKWIYGEFNLTIPPHYLEREELEELYEELQQKYDSLNREYLELLEDYEQLNNTHCNLLADYISLNSSYYALQQKYDSLNREYSELLEDYDNLLADYVSLNSSYYGLQADYSSLLSRLDRLKNDYDTLNSSYNNLLTSYNSLQRSYDLLNSSYNSLNSTYNALKSDFDALQAKYESLESKHQDLKSECEAKKAELDVTRSLMYLFAALTVAFMSTTIYHAKKRKSRSPTREK